MQGVGGHEGPADGGQEGGEEVPERLLAAGLPPPGPRQQHLQRGPAGNVRDGIDRFRTRGRGGGGCASQLKKNNT